MNIKRGMTGVWTLISILWGGYWTNVITTSVVPENRIKSFSIMIGGLLVWWGLLYIGFWISSGFSGDDKKKDETNE